MTNHHRPLTESPRRDGVRRLSEVTGWQSRSQAQTASQKTLAVTVLRKVSSNDSPRPSIEDGYSLACDLPVAQRCELDDEPCVESRFQRFFIKQSNSWGDAPGSDESALLALKVGKENERDTHWPHRQDARATILYLPSSILGC